MSQRNGKYYSLAVRESNGHWGVQFGDWDRRVVVEESNIEYGKDKGYKQSDKIIFYTAGTQKEIDEQILRINNVELGKIM